METMPRVDSFSHISLDSHISKGPIKKRDGVGFFVCVKYMCVCLSARVSVAVYKKGFHKKMEAAFSEKGFYNDSSPEVSRGGSFTRRKERIFGCAHQRWASGLVFMFHFSFICRSVAPSLTLWSEVFSFFNLIKKTLRSTQSTPSHEPRLGGRSQETCLSLPITRALG